MAVVGEGTAREARGVTLLKRVPAWLGVAVLLIACAGPAAAPGGQAEAPQPAVRKRITAGLRGDLPVLSEMLSRAGAGRIYGSTEVERLLNVGLQTTDDKLELRPVLAEAVPTVENGGWRVFPDGRMTTTWKIRPNVVWHDGAPFTSADLLFTAIVVRDLELPEWKEVAFDDIESVEAPDASTVVVNWKRPFIWANTMFSERRGLPQPKHLLESVYLDNKAGYNSHAHWSDGYVGTGAYRLHDFVRSSHLILQANDRFVLGRPSIDEIEVKFIQDANALAANILAGAIDMTLSASSLTLEQAAQVRDQRWDGRFVPDLSGSVGAFPQFIDPSPRIILDAQFRRALLHAIDRQLLVDTLQLGLSQVAHTNMVPSNPEYRDIEHRIVRYAFDPRRAAQLVEALGYARGADGMLRDGASQPLRVELRSTPGREVNEKTTVAVADMWRQVGVGVDVVVIPLQRNQDREYRQTRPGFEVVGQPEDIYRLHSNQVPTPETRFVGDNRPRYSNPQLDNWIERYYVTIPRAERSEILGQMYHHITDEVVLLSFFYEATLRLEASKLRNLSTPLGWNGHQWDVQ